MSSATFTAGELHGWVPFHDTDAAGIVHFANYLRYAEEAEVQALAAVHGISAARYGYPRVHVEVDYRAPLRFMDEYTIRPTLRQIGNSSLTWLFTITCREQICATVTMVSSRRNPDGSAAPYTAEERNRLTPLTQMPEKTPIFAAK